MTHYHPILRVARNVLGFLFLLLGVAGLFLPILQGILFLVIGLSLIDVPQKHRFHRWLSHRLRCYRAIALTHHRVLRKWIQSRRAKAQRKQRPDAAS